MAGSTGKGGGTSTKKGDDVKHQGGDQIRKAQESGGGSKGSKGPAKKGNANASSKS
jgi:hypothetical protein